MCQSHQAARLDLGTGKDRMLCLQEEWYPSHGVATALPAGSLAVMGADGAMTCVSADLWLSMLGHLQLGK